MRGATGLIGGGLGNFLMGTGMAFKLGITYGQPACRPRCAELHGVWEREEGVC